MHPDRAVCSQGRGRVLDRYTAPYENFVPVVRHGHRRRHQAERERIAVLGARSAPKKQSQPAKDFAGYQGQSTWLVLAVLVACWSLPAHAQIDLSGLWTPVSRNQDGSGMTGDAAGVPLTREGQWRAQSWSPEDFDVAEWVCRPHAFDYSLEGPRSWLRFWPDVEQATQRLIAYQGHIEMMGQRATIWMDGRPHPPANALHTWSGFSTGEWDGDVLVVTTTHLKEAYIRRSGLMRSDQATVRTRWRRIGNYLQATSILYDPVYLAEPYVRSTMMWRHDPAMVLPPYPCEEATETAVPRGRTPHFLPGQSPLPGLNPKVTDRFGTPYEPRLGGPDTMYPEYIARIKTFPRPASIATDATEGGP